MLKTYKTAVIAIVPAGKAGAYLAAGSTVTERDWQGSTITEQLKGGKLNVRLFANDDEFNTWRKTVDGKDFIKGLVSGEYSRFDIKPINITIG